MISTESNLGGWKFDNSYARLPEVFFEVVKPAEVRTPRVSILNHRLASDMGLELDKLPTDELAAIFAGQSLPSGSCPIAQAYAGHQFGGFTMLGDGRAILLGEHRTPQGQLVDVQLKGAGRTRYSRGGDGRAALGPMLREYIISEALAALGIPTTRSLAVVTTGEIVRRMTAAKGAILTRVAASHIRVGTFQYAAGLKDEQHVQTLADYAINRHYPEIEDTPQKYFNFFRAVVDRQAALIAQWQLVGFIHGVMNTDNVAISGEAIDFGPCAFMNAYNPETVFSSIDRNGRYSYSNQPKITQWNLARLAEALLPLFDPEQDKAVTLATQELVEFPAVFGRYWLAGMRNKLGLQTAEAEDEALIQGLLNWMQAAKADFTNTFRELSQEDIPADELYRAPEFLSWFAQWQDRLQREAPLDSSAYDVMRANNPAVIPRNHRVEEALAAADEHDDLSPLYQLMDVLAEPYVQNSATVACQQPPLDDRNYQTYCGT